MKFLHLHRGVKRVKLDVKLGLKLSEVPSPLQVADDMTNSSTTDDNADSTYFTFTHDELTSNAFSLAIDPTSGPDSDISTPSNSLIEQGSDVVPVIGCRLTGPPISWLGSLLSSWLVWTCVYLFFGISPTIYFLVWDLHLSSSLFAVSSYQSLI